MKTAVRTWAGRISALAATTLVGAMVMTGAAHADDISNTVDIVGDVKVMTLNTGGTPGATTLFVTPRNSDGKNGCNLTGGTALVVSVVNSNSGVATVSPSSVTFNSCGDTALMTVTPVAEGSTQVGLTQTSNNTGGTFNLVPAGFRVDVAGPANNAPSIAVTGVNQGASYVKGLVPSAGCEVSDLEDGDQSIPATLSAVTGPYAVDGIGLQTATCSYTDSGGLAVTESVSYHIIDDSAPVITGTLDPAVPDGDNGWYVSEVSLDWTVTEAESPSSLQIQGCEDQSVTVDQQETTYSCAASSVGGSAQGQDVTIKRDATNPATPTFVGGPSDNVYFGDAIPTPTCESSDATSGLQSCVVTGGGSSVGQHSFTATATDVAGNSSIATLTYEVLPWSTSGFYNPVNMGEVWNVVKGGSTVPLKFELFTGATELTSTSAIRSFAQRAVTCPGSSAPVDEIEMVTTGGTTLRYDTSGGQFVQNWQTPKKAGTCYVVTMTAQDGSTISANFRLK